jgi:hypothetical protein
LRLHLVGNLAYDGGGPRQEGVRIMKRIVGVCSAAIFLVVVSAWSALAQTTTYPPSESFEGTSGTSPPGGGGTTAFTGSDASRLVLVVAVLLVVGLVMLGLARRRARALD